MKAKLDRRGSRAALAVHTRFGRCHRSLIRMLEILLRPLPWLLQTRAARPIDEVRKILVVEQGRLGDVVLLGPFLQKLRNRFPHAHIALLGRPGLEDLLAAQNFVNELIAIEIPWAAGLPRWRVCTPFCSVLPSFVRQVFRLRQRDFDLSFVSGVGDIRHNFILFLAGARRRVGYGFSGGGFLLTDVVEPDLDRVHRAELSLRLLESLGIHSEPSERRPLSATPEDEEFATELLCSNGILTDDLIVGIHPAAGAAIKEWGEDRFREVAKKIVHEFNAKVIWFSEPRKASNEVCTEVCSYNGRIIPVVLPLGRFLAVLSRCQLVVCNDSGPMHMAAALGVSTVAIFGPELPDWYGPLGSGHRIVIRKGMWCRPCWQKCRFEAPYCLRLISVDEVMRAVTERLETIIEKRARVEAQV